MTVRNMTTEEVLAKLAALKAMERKTGVVTSRCQRALLRQLPDAQLMEVSEILYRQDALSGPTL